MNLMKSLDRKKGGKSVEKDEFEGNYNRNAGVTGFRGVHFVLTFRAISCWIPRVPCIHAFANFAITVPTKFGKPSSRKVSKIPGNWPTLFTGWKTTNQRGAEFVRTASFLSPFAMPSIVKNNSGSPGLSHEPQIFKGEFYFWVPEKPN